MMSVSDECKHGHGNFMEAMPKHYGDADELSSKELGSNSLILIIGGSETTATLQSGVTFWLLETLSAMERVTEELRSTLERDADINFASATARLPSMLA
jgi:cytochrome P450